MKAIVIQQFGGPDVLRYESVPTPQPRGTEVLMRVHSVGVNHMEIDVREGRSGFSFPFPHVMGAEAAGEIVRTGEAVRGFREGDRVMPAASLRAASCDSSDCLCMRGADNLCRQFGKLGISCWGSYAGYLCVEQQNLLRLPDDVSFEDAAAGRTIFSTAWELIVVKGKVRAGETVLINGAGGGVGTASVLVALLCGAQVIATVGSEAKAVRLGAMGVEQIINYRNEDLAASVLRLTGGRGVDLAVETVGGDVLLATVDCMTPGGRIAIGGAHAGEIVSMNIVKLFRRQIQIVTTHSYPKSTTANVFDLMARGKLAPVVAASFPLREAAQAHQLLASRNTFGKVIMTVDADAW